SLMETGAVGEAVDLATQEHVAVKRLPDSLAGDPARLAKYRAFVESLRALHSPGIIGLRGVEAHDGRAFLIMDFAGRGSIVNQLALTGRLPWMEATRRLIEAARVIEMAHARGLVHGAIRPSNLLIASDGTLKVADFGGGLVASRTGDYSAPEIFRTSSP